MAKKKPLFWNGAVNEVIDGTTDTIDESLIQNASGGGNGLLAASDKSKLDSLSAPGFDLTAAASMPAGTVVYIDGSGNAAIAGNDNIATKAKAISLVSLATGSTGSFAGANYGPVTAGSGLTVGGDVFLGAAGALTQTAPTTSGTFVQRLGVAKATNQVVVDIDDPLVLN